MQKTSKRFAPTSWPVTNGHSTLNSVPVMTSLSRHPAKSTKPLYAMTMSDAKTPASGREQHRRFEQAMLKGIRVLDSHVHLWEAERQDRLRTRQLASHVPDAHLAEDFIPVLTEGGGDAVIQVTPTHVG